MNKLEILNAFKAFIEGQEHIERDVKDAVIGSARFDLELPIFDKISTEDGVLELISHRSNLFKQLLFKI